MARDKKYIIGNFKMNLGVGEASLYLHKLVEMVPIHRDVEVILAPTMLTLQSLSLQINRRQFKLAAQNFYWRDHGAFTGEVSASQLRGIVDYAIVGHSERRHIFQETDKDTRAKVQAAIRNGIRPILCIGETASERALGETNDVIHDQLIGGLANITSDELENVIIAYEPVWAIGTGQSAVPDDVVKAAHAIRRQIKHLYGQKAADQLSVIYGAGMTADQAPSYLSLPEIDGFIMGSVSLDAHQFSDIIKKAHNSGQK